MRYLIEVEVDEEKLKAAKCEGMSEADIADMSIEGMIIEEMGWVEDSGIYLDSVREIQENELTTVRLGNILSDIINQDGYDVTDGQVVDQIIDVLKHNGLYKEKN